MSPPVLLLPLFQPAQISSKIGNAKGVLSAKRILEGTISRVMAIEKNKLLLAGRELVQSNGLELRPYHWLIRCSLTPVSFYDTCGS